MQIDQIYNLLARHLSGESTPEEDQALTDWRRQSPANERRYLEVRKLLLSLKGRRPAGLPDRNTSWRVIEAELLKESSGEVPSRSRTNSRNWSVLPLYKIAAAVLLIIAATVVLYRVSDHRSAYRFATAVGEKRQERLADGSTVTINGNSRIDILPGFGVDERRVSLQGESFFTIKATGRPFIVETMHGRVTVLGTRFNVKSTSGETIVVVEQGTVAYESDGGKIILHKHEMSIAKSGEKPAEPTAVDPGMYLAWLTRIMTFERTPLLSVIRKIEQCYGVEIELKTSGLEKLTLSGSFKNQSLDIVLRSVSTALELDYTISGNRIVFSAEPAS